MSGIHTLVGQLAVVLALAAAAWSVLLAIFRRPVGGAFVAYLAVVFVVVAVGAAVGAVVALTSGAPHDSLHLLYGAVAIAALPAAGLIAARRPAGQEALVIAIGCLALLVVLVRLFQTGG